MRSKAAITSGCLFVLLMFPLQLASRTPSHPRLLESVNLPSTYELDFALASEKRNEMPTIVPIAADAAAQAGAQVFDDLIRSQVISSFGLPYHWTFSVRNNASVNAFSLPDGEVAAFSGLAGLVGTDRGLWAAVLSHEIAHVARRHAVQKFLFHRYIEQQIEYWKMRQRLGDKGAGWVVLGIQLAGKVAEAKLSRTLEHDADIQGMLLMSRAGYHPDYAFAMHHLLRLASGEQSKFAAFFSDHPRWTTRDQRNDHAYTDALAEFTRLWPDPAASPGGPAPQVAFLSNVRSVENKARQASDIVLGLSCRNVVEPVTLVVKFSDKNGRGIPASLPEYRDNAGNLQVREFAACVDKEDAVPTTIHVPAALLSNRSQKLEAQIELLGTSRVLEGSKRIDLHVPKSNLKALPSQKVEVEPAVERGTVAKKEPSTDEQNERAPALLSAPPQGGGDRGVGAPKRSAGLPPKESQEIRDSSAEIDPAIRAENELIAAWWPRFAQIPQGDASGYSKKMPLPSPLLFSARSLEFPTLELKMNSAPASVTVTNTGAASFAVAGIRITGVDRADFSEANDCGDHLGPKASCTVVIRFAPTEAGTRTAALTVYDDRDRPNQVLLTGFGAQSN